MAESKPAVTHLSLSQQGYHTIPIIPPDAPLSPNSQIKPEDRGKIPGRRNAGGYWAGFNWLEYKPTDDELHQYTKDGAGIGVVCNKIGGIVALDIDCLDPDTAQWVQEQAHERLGWAPLRTGRAPKALLVYRIDPLSEPVSWRKVEFTPAGMTQAQLIEIRGKGQQFVAYGVHPDTQLPYTWPNGGLEHIKPADLAVVDADDVAQFFENITAELLDNGAEIIRQSSGHGGGERGQMDQAILKAETERLDEALSHIPNTSDQFPARDDYIRFGCAIKAAYADDPDAGFRAWLDWAYRWEDGSHGENEPENDWERMKPPFEIGANYIFETARANGYKDAARVHKPYEGGEGGGEIEFYTRYTWVEDLERFADLREKKLLTKQGFSIRNAHVGSGVQSNKNAAATYHNDIKCRTIVSRTTYRPMAPVRLEEDGEQAVNLWKAGPAHSMKWDLSTRPTNDDVGPWLKLAQVLFPDDREQGLVLDWLAHQIQHPGVKCGWHPVIGGVQGIGKDTLVLPVIEGLGADNVSNIQPGDLHGEWTHWAHHKSLVVVQEMNNFHRKATTDKLKPFLAAPPKELTINRKNLPQFTQPNILNMIFFTNHVNAMQIENGDRRLAVFWSEAEPMDEAFFEGLYDWLERGGHETVCAWLNHRDLSGFNPNARAPHTEGKDMMAEESLSAIESDLKGAMESGEDLFYDRDLFTVEEIQRFLRFNLDYGAQLSSRSSVANVLRSIGAVKLGDRVRLPTGDGDGTGSKRQRVYAVRNADQYKEVDVKDCYIKQFNASKRTNLTMKFSGPSNG